MKSRDPSGEQSGPGRDAIEAGARDVVVRADGHGGSPGGTNYLRLNTR